MQSYYSGFETGKTSTATEGWGTIEKMLKKLKAPGAKCTKTRQRPKLMLQA